MKRRDRKFWKRAALPALLFLTYVLSAVWGLSTPIPTAQNYLVWGNFSPDEYDHSCVVRYMARNRALPPYRPPYTTSVHPPLYHGLAALCYAASEQLVGDVDALLLVRMLTAFCSVGIVYLTWRCARYLLPNGGALLAATFVAVIPMRASLGASIANENLAALGAAGVFAVLLAGLQDRKGFTAARTVLLAFWLVVGIGSKVTCLPLLAVAAIALIWRARMQRESLQIAVGKACLVAAAPAICWGWWFARNVILFGDPFRKAVADRLWAGQEGFAGLSVSKHMTAARYAASLAGNGWRSFWGYFDGSTRLLPTSVFIALLALQCVAVFGFIRYWKTENPRSRRNPMFFLLTALDTVLVSWIFFQYNWAHYTPQGRYYFVLLVPFGLVMAIGWRTALSRQVRRRATPLLIAAFALLNVYLAWAVPRRLDLSNPFGWSRKL